MAFTAYKSARLFSSGSDNNTREREEEESRGFSFFFFFQLLCVDVRHISPGISLMSFLDRKEKSSRIGKTLGKETVVKCCGCSCCCWSGLAVFVVVWTPSKKKKTRRIMENGRYFSNKGQNNRRKPFFLIFHFIFASYKRGTLLVPCQNVSKNLLFFLSGNNTIWYVQCPVYHIQTYGKRKRLVCEQLLLLVCSIK